MTIFSLLLLLTTLGIPIANDIHSSQEPAVAVDSVQIIEKVYLHTDRASYYPGDDIWFKAYLIDAYDRSLSTLSMNLHIELISPSSEIISERIIRLAGGLGNGDFKLPDSLSSGKYRLRAYTNYMRNFSDQIFFNKEINIIRSSAGIEKLTDTENDIINSIDLSFFPEGGSLVDNVSSIVAFKAVDARGKGCNVSGEVYSSAGDMVTAFKSSHLGMGSFVLKPVPGLSYYAIVKGLDNVETKSEIPDSFTTGVTLSASMNNDNNLSITIRTNEQTMPLVLADELILSVSVRNEVVKSIIFKTNSLSSSLVIPTDELPDGIIMLTLTTSENLPLAERLIFIQRDQNLKVNIESDKEVYKKRDPVWIIVSVSGDSKNQETAFLSLSAAEGNYADNISEFSTTIGSWFLLESDVHGTVEGPSYYFDPSNTDRIKDIDLLLRTQGWRDFSWKFDSTKYFSPELGFFVSGRVRRRNTDKPLTDAKINLMIIQGEKTLIEIVPTNESGRFSLENINIKGDARLAVSVVDKNDRPNGLVILDSINYIPAEISEYLPASRVMKKEETLTLIDEDEIKEKEWILAQEYEIRETIREKYKLSDIIELGEVRIIATKPLSSQAVRIESIRKIYGKPDDELIVTPQMENLHSAPELLMGAIAGVTVTPNTGSGIPFMKKSLYKIRIRTGMIHDESPLLLIDGISRDIRDLDIFPIYLIDRIDVLKSAAKTAVFGMDGSFGVISVITRSGRDQMTTNSKSVKHLVNIEISGYDAPRIFYSPHHDASTSSSHNPDLRKTLFWKPNISLMVNKELLLDYSNADNSSTIRIIVEGITSTGIPISGTTEYQVIN